MKTFLTIALSAALLAVFAGPAAAQSNESDASTHQLIVGYADLDLSTERGLQILDRRLRSAATTACGPTSDADPQGRNEARLCRAETLRLAREQRDSAILNLGRSRQIEVAANH